MPNVYICQITRNLSRDEYSSLEQLIDLEKKQRLRKFHRYIDAQRGLLGDVLARYAIGLENGLENSGITFKINEYGKPFLYCNPAVCFNISHAGQYVVCAIDGNQIGIDVEEIKPIDIKIAEKFFCGREKQYVVGTIYEDTMYRFFRVWTMKESYIKKIGKGLSIPLATFDVFDLCDCFFFEVFRDDEAVCSICTETDETPHITALSIDELLNGST